MFELMPSPVKVTLTVGKQYAWCCMRGGILAHGDCKFSHVDKDDNYIYEPCEGEMSFTADRTEAFICTCKQTKTAPYCDGSHKTVKDE